MNILFISAEVVPFSKTGGMGDVCGALAEALARAGHRVLVVSPRYGNTDLRGHDVEDPGVEVGIVAGRWRQDVRYRVVRRHAVHALVEHPVFTERAGIYGDRNGGFGDNHLRFTLLCRAGLEAARRIDIDGAPLGEDCIVHVHDWHTALTPVFLEGSYRPVGLFPRAPTVLTLHNLAHQGLFPLDRFEDLELTPRWLSPWGVEFHGVLAFLKAGIMHADQLTTVSPRFARDILTADGGFGMDGLLRARVGDLHGILNGIDPNEWSPTLDPHLAAPFSADDLTGKAVCKASLQASMGLPVDPNRPLVASVGRLDPQKGVELLIDSIPWLVGRGAQVVVLGSAATAHSAYEHSLRQLEQRFPSQVRAWIGFSEPLAHRIEAGADLFVMPSLFEPCGLNQLYSMRYGTVPVVRATGGLADSVEPYDPGRDTGNGWAFHRFDGWALREALHHALVTWADHPEAFRRLQLRGMARDSSWEAVVPHYEAVYRRAAARRGLPID